MKKLLLFLLFVSLSSYSQQYTAIPDQNFENALISLNFDSGIADGKVLTSNINTVTFLNLYNKNIADLNGIQDFAALNILDCGYNQLTAIDVSKNINLTKLICASNQLTTLDVSKNSNLTYLNCSLNQLTIIDVSKNLSLEYLGCIANQLTSLDVSKNLSLLTLDCAPNKITTLDVSKNLALTDLSCSFNLLTTLDVTNNIALKSLACSGNQLITVDISKNVNLTSLSVDQTKCTNLDISKNVNLEVLYCGYNPLLTTLDVSKQVKLQTLYCPNNQLNTLDVSKNIKLDLLVCGSNKLTYLNLKNGNNTNLQISVSSFTLNPNLSCIQVDNVAYSNANWAGLKDATATYNTNCPALGLEESVFETILIYPNPAKGILHIENIQLENAILYDALGRNHNIILSTNDNKNTIDISNLAKGVYYIYLQTQNTTIVRNIVVE
jgi:Leucine-rich repeat (LRR) protein